jgi:hypothetical protein
VERRLRQLKREFGFKSFHATRFKGEAGRVPGVAPSKV